MNTIKKVPKKPLIQRIKDYENSHKFISLSEYLTKSKLAVTGRKIVIYPDHEKKEEKKNGVAAFKRGVIILMGGEELGNNYNVGDWVNYLTLNAAILHVNYCDLHLTEISNIMSKIEEIREND